MPSDHVPLVESPMVDRSPGIEGILRNPKVIPIAVGLLLLIATAVRLYDIAGPSIWWDEGFSHRWATMPVKDVLRETQNEDFNPPLYYLTLNGWVTLFGDSPTSMRMPSAIASVIAVWLTYLVGCQLTSRGAALCATAAMSIAEFQIVYAHQARCYGLLLMFTLASVYFFLRLLSEWKSLVAIGYVLTTAAMLYLHVYGAFFLAMQCAVVLAIWLTRTPTQLTIKRAIIVQSVLMVLLVPWVLFAMSRAQAAEGSFWIEKPTPRYIGRMIERLAGSLPALVMIIGLAVVAAYGMVKMWRHSDSTFVPPAADRVHPFAPAGAIAFLFTWFLIPHALPIIASIIGTPIYYDRYAIGTTPAMFLLAAVGLSLIPNQNFRILGPHRTLRLSVGLVFALILVRDLRAEIKNPLNTRADELVQYVEKEAKPGDLIVFDGHSGGGQNTFDYYAHRTDLRKKMIHWSFSEVTQAYTDTLKEYAAGTNNVWVITLDRPQKVAAIKDAMTGEYPYYSRFPKEASLKHMCASRLSKTPFSE